ncbi:hypothetical protein ACFVAV_27400 [Nocardia sp. NPDC057663]|uniref:hypothetical protein n=1 Tax=Nocardia sp. NPDC057663 TaxID=3346201 RepID=UPI00366CDC2C
MASINNIRRDSNVIDLQAHRRGRLERAGLDPLAVAVHLLAETGSAPMWNDYSDVSDWDDWGDAA